MKKERKKKEFRRKFNFYNRMVHAVDDRFKGIYVQNYTQIQIVRVRKLESVCGMSY